MSGYLRLKHMLCASSQLIRGCTRQLATKNVCLSYSSTRAFSGGASMPQEQSVPISDDVSQVDGHMKTLNNTLDIAEDSQRARYQAFRTCAMPTLAESWSSIMQGLDAVSKAEIVSKDHGESPIIVNNEFVVRGWVRSVRTQREFVFLMVSDGTMTHQLQVVYGGVGSFNLDQIKKLTLGSSVVAVGKLIRNLRNPATSLDGYELQAQHIDIITLCPIGATKVSIKSTPASRVEDSSESVHASLQGSKAEGKMASTTLNFEGYPLQKKYMTPEYLRSLPHLRLRTQIFGAILRLRSESTFLFHQFFRNKGFCAIQTPIITPLDCEGAGELFEVLPTHTTQELYNTHREALKRLGTSSKNDAREQEEKSIKPPIQAKPLSDYFGSKAFLSVSGQLYAEIAASAVSRVYTFGPTFRAENSNTTRHLSEFWMLEPEIAFCDLKTLCDYVEESIQYVTKELLNNNLAELEKLEALECSPKGHVDRMRQLSKAPFARVTYTDAISILERAFENHKRSPDTSDPLIFDELPVWGDSLSSLHERYLAETYFERPVFVTDYPLGTKPFYMKINENCEEGKTTVACMDLLVPGVGELCGGSQREDNFDLLLHRMHECGLNLKDYKWYAELRRYGGVPHAGWGMGFERFIRYVSGTSNIRDTVIVPRAPNTIEL